MSNAPDGPPRPAPRFETLGAPDVPICTDEGCEIPSADDERSRSEPAGPVGPPPTPAT